MRKNSILVLLFCALPLSAQNVEKDKAALMAEIERNNTTLATLRQKVVAEKQKNAVDNGLPNPSFDFSNTWGNQPQDVPTQNYSVEQEFDWGTITGQRKRTTKSANKVVDLNYQIERQTLLAEAELLIVELTYNNALCEEIRMREERAAELKDLYEKKFKAGDADQLELNKVRLNHTSIVAELRKAIADGEAVKENLKRLNGNKDFKYEYSSYANKALPTLAALQNQAKTLAPQMLILNSNIDLETQRLKVSKSEAFPNLKLGYAGSNAKDIRTNALTIGIDLPLWGNDRRRMKQQKAELAVAKLEKQDMETQINATLTRQYKNAISLYQISEQLKKELQINEDITILDKALSAGKLSLIEYLNEIMFYYDTRTQSIEAERNAQIAIASVWDIFR